MKRVFLFSTRLWVFLFEIPLGVLLALAIHFHEGSTVLFKFYPLEIVLGLTMLFLPIYFFRAVTVGVDEVRTLGLFSSRDRAIINKDKTLILTLGRHRSLGVSVFGSDGQTPDLAWIKNDKDYRPREYTIFRAKALGGKAKVKKVLTAFGVSAEEARVALCDGYYEDFGDFTVECRASGEKDLEIRIFCKKTIL